MSQGCCATTFLYTFEDMSELERTADRIAERKVRRAAHLESVRIAGLLLRRSKTRPTCEIQMKSEAEDTS